VKKARVSPDRTDIESITELSLASYFRNRNLNRDEFPKPSKAALDRHQVIFTCGSCHLGCIVVSYEISCGLTSAYLRTYCLTTQSALLQC